MRGQRMGGSASAPRTLHPPPQPATPARLAPVCLQLGAHVSGAPMGPQGGLSLAGPRCSSGSWVPSAASNRGGGEEGGWWMKPRLPLPLQASWQSGSGL